MELIAGIVNTEQKESFSKDWELDCSYAIKDLCRFRVNIFQEKEARGLRSV
jgi:Tfp pilus assembly pilus retraction ATPase PilT